MDPREIRLGSGEGSTMRNFIVLYLSPNIVRMIKSRRLTRMEEGRSAFTILTGIPRRKRPLERPRRRWEDNTGIDLKEIVIDTRNWVDLV